MAGKRTGRDLTLTQRAALLDTIRARFEDNMHRHGSLRWSDLQSRLDEMPDRVSSLAELEHTGGEPDVVGRDSETGEFVFYDCATESPKGRRSVCYDGAALAARKRFKPDDSAVEMATAMGATLLNEEQYRRLQELGPVDTKTSSWLLTPPDIRKLGGALFGDYRYGAVFAYHNGAESYYAARGFRCWLRV